MDCRLAVGDLELRARPHPSFVKRRGDKVRLTFRAGCCIAIRLDPNTATA